MVEVVVVGMEVKMEVMIMAVDWKERTGKRTSWILFPK